MKKSSTFQGLNQIQGLFKTTAKIQDLFKIVRTMFKGNRKRFELSGVRVIKCRISKEMAQGETTKGLSHCGFELSGFNCTEKVKGQSATREDCIFVFRCR